MIRFSTTTLNNWSDVCIHRLITGQEMESHLGAERVDPFRWARPDDPNHEKEQEMHSESCNCPLQAHSDHYKSNHNCGDTERFPELLFINTIYKKQKKKEHNALPTEQLTHMKILNSCAKHAISSWAQTELGILVSSQLEQSLQNTCKGGKKIKLMNEWNKALNYSGSRRLGLYM